MDRTLDVVLSTLLGGSAWTVSRSSGATPATAHLMLALVTKACKTSRAIRIVCTSGLGQDAGVLVRSLFETTAAIHWVLQKNIAKRTKLFFAHGAIRQYIQIEELAKVPGQKRSAKALKPAALAYRDEATKGLTQGEIDSVKKHWSGLSGGIEAVTKKLGRGHGWHAAYSLVYRDTSSTAHVSDSLKHIGLGANDVLEIKLVPGDADLPRVPIVAQLLLHGSATRVDEKLRLGFGKTLKRAKRKTK